jgi:hypothetical protein
MDKADILSEIKRTTTANGGVPLGIRRFCQEADIKQADFIGKYWARWSDALKEAGYQANQLTSAYSDETLLKRYVDLIRELGHFPVSAELQMKAHSDKTFPSEKTYRRFGSKRQLAAKLLAYCQPRPGHEDVARLCEEIVKGQETAIAEIKKDDTLVGFVYLMRAGRYFKIGKTNAVGRRERELAIQLPEKPNTVHVIRTDDPAGIEAYWHRRFTAKRMRDSEWFDLSSADVAAFKRRRTM